MPAYQAAKLMRLLFSERHRYKGKPTYEAIVEKCRELHMAGATVVRGLEGFGETAEIHRPHLLSHDLPIVVTIVDSAENIERLAPIVEEMMDTGLIAVSNVQIRRIQKNKVASNVQEDPHRE
jgi:PII-like signaling protein